MSVHRSPNCASYNDSVQVIVTGTATSADSLLDGCTVDLPPTFSCQTEVYDTPDAATVSHMEENAKSLLSDRGCDASSVEMDLHATTLGGNFERNTNLTGKRLVELGLASNCFIFGNDPNDVTHQIQARCTPMYELTDPNGNRVRDYSMIITSALGTCDSSDAAFEDLMRDARRAAAFNASNNGYTVDREEDLACKFAVLPVL